MGSENDQHYLYNDLDNLVRVLELIRVAFGGETKEYKAYINGLKSKPGITDIVAQAYLLLPPLTQPPGKKTGAVDKLT